MVVLAVGVSWILNLGLVRSLLAAVFRATVQLLLVGYVLVFLIGQKELPWSWIWPCLWAGGMVVVAAIVLARRSPSGLISTKKEYRHVLAVSTALLTGCVAITLTVFFGFDIFDYQPITMVVFVGLTIGNAMPGAVLAVKQTHQAGLDRSGEIEALLALGYSRRQAVSYLTKQPAQLALVPQIERTKVVGVIALPGAMSGLLLAGADPIEAVVTQLLVMFMVLGAVAISVMVMAVTISLMIITTDLRVAPVNPHVKPGPAR